LAITIDITVVFKQTFIKDHNQIYIKTTEVSLLICIMITDSFLFQYLVMVAEQKSITGHQLNKKKKRGGSIENNRIK
jgi:hypothetical protein